jgi:predicted DNA-binding protein YlxM (UPF0122 family)
MVVGFNKYSYLPRTMRKVAIRWNLSSLYGSNDISQILDIVEKIEVLGHLSISKEGIIQLAEIKLKDNKNLKDFSNLPNFEIIKKYEEDEDGILVSVLCTVRNFVSLLRNVLPPDKISVQSLKGNNIDNWIDNLTSRQKETLSYAAYRGYYNTDSKTTLRELAEELGMARSTLGEHIQRAELSIIRKAIEDLGLEKSKLNPNAQSTVADGK